MPAWLNPFSAGSSCARRRRAKEFVRELLLITRTVRRMVKKRQTSSFHEGNGIAGPRVTEAPSCAAYQRRKCGRLLPPMLLIASSCVFIASSCVFFCHLGAHLGGLVGSVFVPGHCSRHESGRRGARGSGGHACLWLCASEPGRAPASARTCPGRNPYSISRCGF